VTNATLVVNGSLSDPIIGPGGVLNGTGSVGATQINAGGTLAPGPIGGILNPTTSSFATVTGTASLTGGTVRAVVSGSPNKSFDILHAAGGLGGTTFSAVSVNNFNASLSYTATDVFLTLSPALGAGTPLNQNQQGIANVIGGFVSNGGTLPSTAALASAGSGFPQAEL
jgi:hypothetical protein